MCSYNPTDPERIELHRQLCAYSERDNMNQNETEGLIKTLIGELDAAHLETVLMEVIERGLAIIKAEREKERDEKG